MEIRYTDGGRGTATREVGKLGEAAGMVIVLRRGYPVAAEIVGAFPERMLSGVLLAALDIADAYAVALDLESVSV